VSEHRVILADCLGPEGLATLPDKSVDHVITDPPYSEKVHTASRRGSMRPEPGKGDAAFSRTRDLGFAHLTAEVRDGCAVQFARVVRRWVLVFCDVEGVDGWRRSLVSAGLEYVRTGAWIKEGGTPQFTGDRPAVGFEAIVIAHPPGRKRWNGGGRQAVWSEPIVLNRGGDDPRFHTTQKPLPLLEALVRDFTDPGDLIADPFAGSGTTIVAAKRLGRSAVGWDSDQGDPGDPDENRPPREPYAVIAQKRIDGAREQLGLFRSERPPEPKQASILVALGASSHGEGR
jgi:site-specific DNA-methyltransferase (adenine-specific)